MKAQDIISGNTALLSALIVLSMFQLGFCSQVWVGAGQNILTYDTEGSYLSSFHAGGLQSISAIEVVNDNVWVANGQNILTYDTEGSYLSSFNAGGIQSVSAIEVVNDNVWVANGQNILT